MTNKTGGNPKLFTLMIQAYPKSINLPKPEIKKSPQAKLNLKMEWYSSMVILVIYVVGVASTWVPLYLNVHSQEVVCVLFNCHIWNLCHFLTQFTKFHNEVIMKTGNQIWTITKMKF